MKKTLVALAVAAVAATSAASAATVYDQDGSKVEFGGRIDAMVGKFGKDQRGDLRNNESQIELKATQDLGNGLKALGYYRLRFNEDGDRWYSYNDDGSLKNGNSFNNPTTNKLWVALEHEDIGRLAFGRQDTTADAVQLNDPIHVFGGNNNLFTGSEKVAYFRSVPVALVEGHTLEIGADYVFGKSDKYNATKSVKNGYGTSLFYVGKFSDEAKLELNAGYTRKNYDDTYDGSAKTGAKEDSWRVASLFSFGPAALGVEYGQTLYKNVNSSIGRRDINDGKGKFWEVGARYAVTPAANVFFQWQRNSFEGVSSQDFSTDLSLAKAALRNVNLTNNQKAVQNAYIVSADYAVTKNFVPYVEYAHSRTKAPKGSHANINGTTLKENFYAAGMRIYF